MLKVEDVQAITNYCRGLGKSARQAANVFRRSRNTIARVLKDGAAGILPGDIRRRRPQVLLDEHQRFVDAVLLGREGGPVFGKQKHNGISITNLLRTCRGYTGSVSQVRRYIQRRRGELGLLPRGDVTLDRVKEATALCEADWTEVKIYLNGIFTTIWLLVVRFRFSGAHFVRGYRAKDTECLLDGLQRAFDWFGGVPPVLQMDNMTVAVSKVLKGRSRQECKLYAAFRAHYGYRAQYTMVSCPDENGTVEATMGPVTRWLVPIPCVTRMADLNAHLVGCCERYLQHQIRDRTGLVGVNFAVEKNLLMPLPPRRYDIGREDHAGVNGQSRFMYRDVWYSVPVAYRSREVVVKGYAEEVTARCDGREIARHARGFQKGELVLDPMHYLPVLQRKPHVLDHAAAFRRWDLPLIYERFRRELEQRSAGGLREYVEVLSLLRQFSQQEVTAALRRSAANRTFSAQAVLFHLRLRERRQDAPALETADRWNLPQIEIARPDLARYEALAM